MKKENERQIQNLLKNLKALKEISGYSDEEMASALKLHPKKWQEIEEGRLPTGISVEILFLAEARFHIKISHLFESDVRDRFPNSNSK